MLQNLFRNNILRHTIVLSALTVPIVALNSETALADKSNFRVYNESSTTVRELYVSDSRQDNWGNDVLGRDVLYTGDSIRVAFGNPSPRVCLYDIRAVFVDGQVVEDYQVNVCANDQYTFYDQ